MKLKKVQLITYSPTHTSKRVGEAIVRGLAAEEVVVTDLTLPDYEPVAVEAGTLVVLTAPVYGGHVPTLAVHRLNTLRWEPGAYAVVAAVYGNRAYENALLELSGIARSKECKVIAGATFVGEHSYSSDRYPIAVGRPNADDLADAEIFGAQVAKKISAAEDDEHLYAVDVRRIPRPKQPLWPMLKFIRQVLKWRKHPPIAPRCPQVDAGLCKHCGLCRRACPNAAIEKGKEHETFDARCTKCCACVKVCPHGARSFDTPYAPLLSKNFTRPKENKTLL